MGKEENSFKKEKSVDWYDPGQLIKTGIKVLISSIFGDFNDKRELQAALNHDSEKKYFDDFSQEKDLWIDYISDTGDGFDATFTMAKLLAERTLDANGIQTQRGQILIMGGDQVYPVANREEYKNRFQGPYTEAFPLDENDKKPPHVFAIPGNHDWYDGLTSFLKIFGQKRGIGNLRTQQSRSYFALRLPYNVWLFGIDIQLNSDIDYNQIKYFEDILNNKMEPNSKVILCTAEPAWIHHTSNKTDSYNNLKFFESKIKKCGNAIQVLTLAGDLHHYSRYKAIDGSYKITSGGGGAFMHPTQNLPKQISDLREGEITLQKTFPSSNDSKKMLFRNAWFAISSWKFSAMIGSIYLFVSSVFYLHFGFFNKLPLINIFQATLMNPIILAVCLLLIVGFSGFSDTSPSNSKNKSTFHYSFFGLIHGIIQTLLILLVFWKVTSILSNFNQGFFEGWITTQIFMFVVGGLLGGTVFGLYLILTNLFLKNHDNEAYSSLRFTGYKNFIRIHITENELKIYPFGVKNIQKWSFDKEGSSNGYTPDIKIKPELIENIEPIKLSQ